VGKTLVRRVIPILLFAGQNRLPDDAGFRLMPAGNPVDVEVRHLERLRAFKSRRLTRNGMNQEMTPATAGIFAMPSKSLW